MRIVDQNWQKPRKGAAPAIKKFASEAQETTTAIRSDSLNIVTLYGVFVQTGTGTHIRSSLVKLIAIDSLKRIIYNSVFLPYAPITDYRTSETSLTAADFEGAASVADVRNEVRKLLVNKVLGFNTQKILNQLGVHVPSRRILDLNHSYYGSVSYIKGMTGLDAILRSFGGTKYSINPIEKVRLIYELYLKRKNSWYSDLATYYKVVQGKVDPSSVLDTSSAPLMTDEDDHDNGQDHKLLAGNDSISGYSYSSDYSYSTSSDA
ncbi:Hypothetical protein GLP15_2231 [Giardia lamblia P15]|uniref:Uncharacterized protein n=1 Tax=Giardia intestinalis (strain P15) TaxID=658858 RepID=E1F756_GIAIA|nr:Hypothetical protein GLP15_2231 [Giardia lamblia P15]